MSIHFQISLDDTAHPEREAIWQLSESGVDHLCEHRYPEATACLTLAIEKAEALFGPDGVELAPLLNNLAAVHEHQGQLAEVETTLLRALRIRENALGLCGDTGQSYANLGHLYLTKNEYDQAEKCYLLAIAGEERSYGPVCSGLTSRLGHLADLYTAMGKEKEASLVTRRVQVNESLYQFSNGPLKLHFRPPYHYPSSPLRNQRLVLAWDLSDDALASAASGRLSRASDASDFARRIAIEELGADHHETAMLTNNQAVVFILLEQFGAAEDLLKQALAFAENCFLAAGGDLDNLETKREWWFPGIQDALVNLGCLYRKMQKWHEAESCFLRALQLEESRDPEYVHWVDSYLQHLAELYECTGEAEKAAECRRRITEHRNEDTPTEITIGEEAHGRQN